MGPGPQVEILRDKLRAIIQTNALGTPIRRGNALKSLYDIGTTIALPNVERRRKSAEVVNDRQYADLAAIEQLIGQKVHRPAIVRAEEKRPVIERWGLLDRRPSKALPPMVSYELSGMYFEVYQVPETHLTAILRSGGDWRWHFCTSDGCVEVTSGSYPTETACISAIDILRGGAGNADLLPVKKS